MSVRRQNKLLKLFLFCEGGFKEGFYLPLVWYEIWLEILVRRVKKLLIRPRTDIYLRSQNLELGMT